MPSVRDFRRRIRSVRSTMQVTKAMEMVSAAKLRRSQQRVISARPYSDSMKEILERVSSAAGEFSHPFFETRPGGKTCLVVITSDKGLCGSYNTNVLKNAEELLKKADPGNTVLFPMGKKGFDYFRKRKWKIAGHYTDIGGRLDLKAVRKVTDELLSLYLSGEVNGINLLYTSFISLLNRKITLEKFLPISPPGKPAPGAHSENLVSGTGSGSPAGTAAQTLDYIFEPSPEMIFESLLPRYTMTRVFMALAESLASENSARMVAMSAATKNAEEMIGSLTLTMNRQRQALITKELSEIVGGAESLR